MANLRAAQKEMTRKLLLSTALELFRTKGYAATTVDDIASTAGTTRVTFYAYFRSRSDLARALLDELNVLLERTSAPPRGSTGVALVDAVRGGTHAGMSAWLRERSAIWERIRPHLNAVTEAAAVDPDLRGAVDGWFEEVIADIKDGLDQAGRFDPAVRHARAVLAFAQLDYLGQRWVEGRWGVDRQTVVAVLADSWFTLLGNRPPDPESPGV
ncbi:helix-turn-helix domain-containing protein [Actinoplanes sp. NPDC023714]|uniref:TetR/AcrR family transcriptional regulator n=1 Tax=Actinoplanes sp. NPDC023714 TaxID=3154322 RepID=UPI0033F59B73